MEAGSPVLSEIRMAGRKNRPTLKCYLKNLTWNINHLWKCLYGFSKSHSTSINKGTFNGAVVMGVPRWWHLPPLAFKIVIFGDFTQIWSSFRLLCYLLGSLPPHLRKPQIFSNFPPPLFFGVSWSKINS